jgi:hypothetical protein
MLKRLAEALAAAGVSLDADSQEMVADMLADDESLVDPANKTGLTDLLEMSSVEHDDAEMVAGHFFGLDSNKPKPKVKAVVMQPIKKQAARPVVDRKSAKSLRKNAAKRRAQKEEDEAAEPTSLASLVANKRGDEAPGTKDPVDEQKKVTKKGSAPPMAPKLLAAPIKLSESDMAVSKGSNIAFSPHLGLDNMLAKTHLTTHNSSVDRGEGGKDHNETKKDERRKLKELQQQNERKAKEAKLKKAEQAELLTLSEGLDDEATEGGRRTTAGAVDVHLEGFNLENKKESGEDLLQNATLTLSAGRCYALIGRNGIGKTTLLQAMARRKIENMPSSSEMRVLLVRHGKEGGSTFLLLVRHGKEGGSTFPLPSYCRSLLPIS